MSQYNNLFKIVSIALVALCASIGLWFYLNTYLSKSKASETVANALFSPTTQRVISGETVSVTLTVAAGTAPLSGVYISFINKGEGLEFVKYVMPAGFTEQLVEGTNQYATDAQGVVTKKLKHLSFVAATSKAKLRSSFVLQLYFKAIQTGGQTSAILLHTNSYAVGPIGKKYTIQPVANSSSFEVTFKPQPAGPVVSLACNEALNKSYTNCGKSLSIAWRPSFNEDRYEVFRNGVKINTLTKNTASYNDMGGCAVGAATTYVVKGYNAETGATNDPPSSVSCTCYTNCPPAPSITPTAAPPKSSADIKFHLVFPDAVAGVDKIENVKITIFDKEGKRICPDDTDCAKFITVERDVNAQTPNTFNTPQLKYDFEKNQAYTIVVKHAHTVKQTYKNIYLTWKNVLQCLEGTSESRCGDLIATVATRPMLAGDLDNNNKIEQADLDIVNANIGKNSNLGDLNFDNTTDLNDVAVISANFGKSGQ